MILSYQEMKPYGIVTTLPIEGIKGLDPTRFKIKVKNNESNPNIKERVLLENFYDKDDKLVVNDYVVRPGETINATIFIKAEQFIVRPAEKITFEIIDFRGNVIEYSNILELDLRSSGNIYIGFIKEQFTFIDSKFSVDFELGFFDSDGNRLESPINAERVAPNGEIVNNIINVIKSPSNFRVKNTSDNTSKNLVTERVDIFLQPGQDSFRGTLEFQPNFIPNQIDLVYEFVVDDYLNNLFDQNILNSRDRGIFRIIIEENIFEKFARWESIAGTYDSEEDFNNSETNQDNNPTGENTNTGTGGATTKPIISPPQGSQEFTGTGTRTFTVPDGVTKISAVCIGGGGAGDYGDAGGGGGGGGLAYHPGFDVTPGEKLTVVVGNGGTFEGPGGASSIRRGNNTLLIAYGGAGSGVGRAKNAPGGPGGGFGGSLSGIVGYRGGHGSNGGNSLNQGGRGAGFGAFGGQSAVIGKSKGDGGGGGGAAGYGVQGNSASGGVGTSGRGGAGGGGGTSLFGPFGSASRGGNAFGGGDNEGGGSGGTFGGGGGGADKNKSKFASSGGRGGVRIIYGNGFSYPNNAIVPAKVTTAPLPPPPPPLPVKKPGPPPELSGYVDLKDTLEPYVHEERIFLEDRFYDDYIVKAGEGPVRLKLKFVTNNTLRFEVPDSVIVPVGRNYVDVPILVKPTGIANNYDTLVITITDDLTPGLLFRDDTHIYRARLKRKYIPEAFYFSTKSYNFTDYGPNGSNNITLHTDKAPDFDFEFTLVLEANKFNGKTPDGTFNLPLTRKWLKGSKTHTINLKYDNSIDTDFPEEFRFIDKSEIRISSAFVKPPIDLIYSIDIEKTKSGGSNNLNYIPITLNYDIPPEKFDDIFFEFFEVLERNRYYNLSLNTNNFNFKSHPYDIQHFYSDETDYHSANVKIRLIKKLPNNLTFGFTQNVRASSNPQSHAENKMFLEVEHNNKNYIDNIDNSNLYAPFSYSSAPSGFSRKKSFDFLQMLVKSPLNLITQNSGSFKTNYYDVSGLTFNGKNTLELKLNDTLNFKHKIRKEGYLLVLDNELIGAEDINIDPVKTNSSGCITVPRFYNKVFAVVIGGGGSGGKDDRFLDGTGGGGGAGCDYGNVNVKPGDRICLNIGRGGSNGGSGGDSTLTVNGSVRLRGGGGGAGNGGSGGSGGSGKASGGKGGKDDSGRKYSNGSDRNHPGAGGVGGGSGGRGSNQRSTPGLRGGGGGGGAGGYSGGGSGGYTYGGDAGAGGGGASVPGIRGGNGRTNSGSSGGSGGLGGGGGGGCDKGGTPGSGGDGLGYYELTGSFDVYKFFIDYFRNGKKFRPTNRYFNLLSFENSEGSLVPKTPDEGGGNIPLRFIRSFINSRPYLMKD